MRPSPEHVPSSGQATPIVIGRGLVLLHVNVEGFSKAKSDVLAHLGAEHEASVILLQETHVPKVELLQIPEYTLAAHTLSPVYGISTFVHKSLRWTHIATSPPASEIEWTTISNSVSMELPSQTCISLCHLYTDSLPRYPAHCVYAGDFNCHSTTWGYSASNSSGAALKNWASAADVTLLHDPKQPHSFRSARWGTFSNPDLAFINLGSRFARRQVLEPFPKSQHRPALITTSASIQPVPTRPVKRWNFRKADWAKFEATLDSSATKLPSASSHPDTAYSAWCNTILAAAKVSIPRGCREHLIPTWDKECQLAYNAFIRAAAGEEANIKAEQLTTILDAKRRLRWESDISTIDFTHSSRRAWQTFNRLTGRVKKSPSCPISANAIASKLVESGRHREVDKLFTREVNAQIAALRSNDQLTEDSALSEDFSNSEILAAVAFLKNGKAQGPDSIAPEFVIHCGAAMLDWLRQFFSHCLKSFCIPKIWRRAIITAVLKPNKPPSDPKSYRPISLLCVPFKLLERLLLLRLNPIIDPKLPQEQAGFRRGRSTTDQITLLTDDIETGFQDCQKIGVILVDLTAAYDTVWLRGLHLKLLRLVPNSHIVKFVMELLSNRSFILKTNDGQTSRLRRLRNGVPQGSTLAPTLFNVYISDLPNRTAKQYGYADDLALLTAQSSWSRVQHTLQADMIAISDYLKRWRLTLSTAKNYSHGIPPQQSGHSTTAGDLHQRHNPTKQLEPSVPWRDSRPLTNLQAAHRTPSRKDYYKKWLASLPRRIQLGCVYYHLENWRISPRL